MSRGHRSGVMALLVALIVAGCSAGAGTEQAKPSREPVALPTPGSQPAEAVQPPSAPPGTAVPADPAATAPPSGRPALVLPPARTPAPHGQVTVASRIVIDDHGIDLPIVSGDLDVAGNPPAYPLCDVAQYLPAYRQPPEPGTTYIYAHAQRGMFLPLLRASERADGAQLLGQTIDVYTSDGMRYRYEIFAVKRHATDYRLADTVRPGDRRLVIQTSEGPSGTVPKLQIGADLVEIDSVPLDEARPPADPRVCA